jgi:two-component system nitrate/nitrite response regulator NarL
LPKFNPFDANQHAGENYKAAQCPRQQEPRLLTLCRTDLPRDETMHDEKEDETMHELMVIKEAGPSEMQRLTPRERGIAHLVCAGLTNKQIAQELAVTEGTIKVHLHNVYEKLAIRNRTTLALLCVKQIEAVE